MKISGGSPFRNIRQAQSTSKTSKTKGTKKKGFSSAVGGLDATAATDSLEQLEPIDSPLYDVMAEQSKKFERGESDLEEATRAVVSAMIREHFGKKNLPDKTLDEIAKTVSSSINGDGELSTRLEKILRRVSSHQNKLAEAKGS